MLFESASTPFTAPSGAFSRASRQRASRRGHRSGGSSRRAIGRSTRSRNAVHATAIAQAPPASGPPSVTTSTSAASPSEPRRIFEMATKRIRSWRWASP